MEDLIKLCEKFRIEATDSHNELKDRFEDILRIQKKQQILEFHAYVTGRVFLVDVKSMDLHTGYYPASNAEVLVEDPGWLL
jgi:hypothetical protein